MQAGAVLRVARPTDHLTAIAEMYVTGLDCTVLARIPVRQSVARAVDAGVLAMRLPDSVARPTTRALTRLGVIAERIPRP